MRPSLSLLTLAVALLPGMAAAGPVIPFVQGAAAALGGGTLAAGASAAAAAGFGFAGSALGGVVLRIGASFLLQAAAQALAPKPKQPDLKRELALPQSRPPWRTVYGHARVPGTPAPWRGSGYFLYAPLILNSRPSAGTNLRVLVDKRVCTVESGSLTDYAGAGALLRPEGFRDWEAADLFFRAWLGTGGQTAPPPQIMTEFGDAAATDPERPWPSDGWTGRTVLWVAMNAGGSVGMRAQRWPAVPPQIEVEGDWTPVWDPRDPAQDPDDPATWTWSDNQALCLLDALRTNPVRRYADAQLHLASFLAAADVADQAVPLAAGGTEPRYRAAGVVVWQGGELLGQIEPLAAAGAGRLVRIGGQLGYAPGAWAAPAYTATDILDDGGLEHEVLRPGRDVPGAVRGVFTAPDRDWEEAELPLLPVAGGAGGDGDNTRELPLPLVTSATQAGRVVKIEAERLARQRRLRATLPPDAIDLVAGSTVATALPGRLARLDGTWTVESADPGLWLSGEGVALRVPVTLRAEDAAVYAWDPEADEAALRVVPFDPAAAAVAAPGVASITVGAAAEQGGQPAVAFALPESPSARATGYEWQWRPSGGAWREGGTLSPEAAVAGVLAGALVPVTVGADYDLRFRAVAGPAEASDWVTAAGITAVAPPVDLGVPSGIGATGGAGQIAVSATAPNSADLRAVEIWGAATDDVAAAALVGTVFAAPNAPVAVTETGLGAAETRHYFARSLGPYGTSSAFSASASATTDP